MPIEYTNQPLRLDIKATLYTEDGQEFNFNGRCTDFTENGDTVASYFDTISEQVYDKLEEFSVETEDEEDFDDGDEYFRDLESELDVDDDDLTKSDVIGMELDIPTRDNES